MNELIAQLRNLMGSDSSDDQLRSKIEQIQNHADHGSPLYFVCEAALKIGRNFEEEIETSGPLE